MPAPSLTITEFSALVSAALDGSDSDLVTGVLSANGTDVGKLGPETSFAVPDAELAEPRSLWFDSPLIEATSVGHCDVRKGPDGKNFKAGNPKDGRRRSGHRKKICKQLSLTFNPRFDSHISSSKAKMLLVQPPGEGPFPPAVTVPTVKVRGPIPAASMSDVDLGANCLYLGSGGACGKFTAQERGATTSTLSPPPTNLPRRVDSSGQARGLFSRIKRHLSMTNLRSGNMTTTTEDAEVIGGEQELQSATTRAGAVVSFASSPSFHSALRLPSTTDSTLESCPDITGSVSTPPSLHRDSLTSSPSLYSRESADASDQASYIGSSSSFFASVARGLDGRKSRIGSDAYTDCGASFADHGSLMSESEMRNANFSNNLDYNTPDANAADCYMPYVPLIMQHERLQHQLRTRVSLNEVASLARSSLGSSPSVRSRVTMSSLRDKYKAPVTNTTGARPRKHVPPPLKASSSELRFDSPATRTQWNQEIDIQHESYSPTSTVSSRSPITPRTPFNFATDAQPHTGEQSAELNDDEDGVGDFHKGIRVGIAAESKPRRFTTQAETNAPSVNIHPPTPPSPSLQPAFVDEHLRSGSIIGVIDAIDQSSATRTPSASPTRSISRRYSAKAPPPMVPPPSGPLPLPPKSSTSFESPRPMMEPSAKLSRFSSPSNAHYEWRTTHHTAPFMNGSLTPTTGMLSAFKKPSQTENVDGESERHLNFTPADDSAVAFNGHRISLNSVLTESSAFFSAQSQLSGVDVDDGDVVENSSLRLSLAGRLSSDIHSASSCANSEDSETYARNAMLSANTRANATVVRNIPTQAIGVGRQQLGAAESTSGNTNGEWTLSLGSPLPRRAVKHKSVADLARSRLLYSDSVAPTAPPAFMDSDREALMTSTPQMARKLAIPGPSDERPSLNQVNLRTRTKSESALGKRHGILAAQAATPTRKGNDDWTLSMPLPFFTKSPKATASASRAGPEAQDECCDDIHLTAPQRDIVVTVAGVDLIPGGYTRTGLDEDELSLAEEDTVDAEPNLFTVPRIVSVGSGIESATFSKSDVKRISLLDDEAFDTMAGEGSNANLAKLDILSQDLARFNDLLRHSKSLLEMRPGSSASRTQSDSCSFSSSVIGIFQGSQGLSKTLSPPHLQVCHDQIRVTSSAAFPPVRAAHPPESHLSASRTELPSDAIQDHVAESITPMCTSSLAPPTSLPGGYRSSLISTSSTSSSATVKPMNVRGFLPSASPPMVGKTLKTPSSMRKDESPCPPSSSTPVVKRGPAAGSAMAPSLENSQFAGLSRSLRIDINAENLSVTPVADKDSLSGEIMPEDASFASPFPLSVPVDDSVPSTFPLGSQAKPTDLRKATSMVGEPAPTRTASADTRSRRGSCSSLSLSACTNLSGSPSSKISVEFLAMGSSALAPICPKPSTSCPPPSKPLYFASQAAHAGASENGASKLKGTLHQDIGTNLKTNLLVSRASSVSSSVSSQTSVESTRPVASNLEYRIRQLRLLGVDASPSLTISQNNFAQIVPEANTPKNDSTGTEIDAESVYSGFYYSARSSFSTDHTRTSGTELNI